MPILFHVKRQPCRPQFVTNNPDSAMKSVYDFLFCSGTLGLQNVWYRVYVGTSSREKAAFRHLSQVASFSPFMILARHDSAMMAFREQIARQLLPSIPYPSVLMRTKHVNVRWLVSFLRRNPAALLNSKRIDTPIDVPALLMSGWKSSAEIQLRKSSCLSRTSSKNLSRHGA